MVAGGAVTGEFVPVQDPAGLEVVLMYPLAHTARMRVALAAVLFMQPDLLLLDEPTNYLDLEGTLWLQDHLARYPHTLIVISHDRDLLDISVNFILSLEATKLTLYRGNYSTFEKTRSERIHLDQKLIKKQEAQRKHLQAFVDRFRAKASKARQALPAGSSRARVTTANARWARHCEQRDRLLRLIAAVEGT